VATRKPVGQLPCLGRTAQDENVPHVDG
jgi:hypothetical protein